MNKPHLTPQERIVMAHRKIKLYGTLALVFSVLAIAVQVASLITRHC